MKRVLVCLFAVLVIQTNQAQTKSYDSVAILILDRMSDIIGDLQSCSFKLSTISDVSQAPYGLVKQFGDYEVFISGSDKMLVNVHGHRGHSKFAFNGQQLAYYSFDENNFGYINASGNTLHVIDSVNKSYGIDFPAIDFFYPAFTDDLMENCDSIKYLGMEKVEAKEFFHVICISKDETFQFWINNDSYNLPAKFAITYKKQEGNPQYIASFSDWQINPVLPGSMFDFVPPPGAAKLRILSKTEK